ncbi:hypothetical protein N6H13_09275 [Paenibacillus sp. CC-CFT742]|nr:hypothetical protein [Paenibacillus sp. CC-CFT742]WJH30781.1 hypothetical protein N6H13_09275 [Paenibacillus sp. CC-CFT742]
MRKLVMILACIFIISGCSDEKSEKEISISLEEEPTNNTVAWLNETKNFLSESYTQVDKVGGYNDISKLYRIKEKEKIDLSNSAWNLKSLSLLEFTPELDKPQKQNLEKLLNLEFLNNSDQALKLYNYWTMSVIYNELSLDLPDNYKKEILQYVDEKTDKHGFFLVDEGPFDSADSTLISVRLRKELSESFDLDYNFLSKQIDRIIRLNDQRNELISYAMILFESNGADKIDKTVYRNLVNHYTEKLKKWNFNTNGNIDELYLHFIVAKQFNIDFEIPSDVTERFKTIIEQQINYNQFPDGSLTYELLSILPEDSLNANRDKFTNFILNMRSDNMLWNRSLLRDPNLKDTQYASVIASIVSPQQSLEEMKSIFNLYIQESNSDFMEVSKLPALLSIFYTLKDYGIILDKDKINIYAYFNEISVLPVEQEAQLLVDLYEVYKINEISIDESITRITNDILLKIDDLEKVTVDLKTMSGFMLANLLEGKDNPSLFKIMEKYNNKDGYSFNMNSDHSDLLGNYYANFILGDFGITEVNYNILNFRTDYGYSLYSSYEDISNLQLTYYGLLLENKLSK